MSDRAIQIVEPEIEASIIDYHGGEEDITARGEGGTDYQAPTATRREVEAELSFDLIDSAMRGAL